MSGCVFGSLACEPGTRRFALHVLIVEWCSWQHYAGLLRLEAKRRRPL